MVLGQLGRLGHVGASLPKIAHEMQSKLWLQGMGWATLPVILHLSECRLFSGSADSSQDLQEFRHRSLLWLQISPG